MIAIEEAHLGRVFLSPGTTFDAAAARQLHEILGRTPAGSTVLVDFRRVRDSHDAAMAMLAQDLAQAPGRVSIVGLREQQYRHLRCLGIDQAESGPRDLDPRPIHPSRR